MERILNLNERGAEVDDILEADTDAARRNLITDLSGTLVGSFR